jgi:threonine dehydrogenase-like Zn-dependent dehydrogenase
MRAAVFKGAGVLELEDVPDPVVEAADDVVIEVEACGICGSDLQILNVPPGHPADVGVVMGHEFIGRVHAVGAGATGAGAGLAVGQRVTVDPDPKCGVCGPCRAGRPASCEDIRALGIFRDGALASHVKAPAAAVFPISDAPPAPVAALIEPLACVVNGVNKANPRPGETAIIFGAGAIGCLFLAMFKAAGAAPVIVVEPQRGRAAVAAAVGADAVVHPDELAERRAELMPDGADILVDAVGSQFATAVDHAALGGRIVLFGMNATARPAIHQYTITHRSLSVLGAYVTAFTFPTAIRLVESGSLPLDPIVTHVLPLEHVGEGLDLLRSGDATKVVITPGAPRA